MGLGAIQNVLYGGPIFSTPYSVIRQLGTADDDEAAVIQYSHRAELPNPQNDGKANGIVATPSEKMDDFSASVAARLEKYEQLPQETADGRLAPESLKDWAALQMPDSALIQGLRSQANLEASKVLLLLKDV